MAARAIWKGHLKVGELICPVALYGAVSSSERISLHMLNRETGNRLQRQFIDQETGEKVEREDQVKGYATGPDDYVILEPDEIAAAVPESDKTLSIESFIPCNEIDTLYFDKPYFLVPSGADADKAYGVLHDGLKAKKAVALAKAILFRRVRTVLIRPVDEGFIATTLNFDYEIRSAADAFHDIKDITIKKEMLDLACHIIETKRGSFEPKSFHDRYDAALAELVQAKAEGREIKKPEAPAATKPFDLMEALRQSASGKTNVKAAVKKPAAKKGPEKKAVEKKAAPKKKTVSKAKAARKTAAAHKTPQRKAS